MLYAICDFLHKLKMIPRYLTIALVLMGLAVSPEWASGSRPVKAVIIGCVIEGLFISRETTLQTDRGFQTFQGSHFIQVRGIDLRQYEGQTLLFRGSLVPSDYFYANEQNLQILSPFCDVASIPNFKQTFSWAWRTLARKSAESKAYEEALRYINRAIEVDPAQCEFFVSRAEIYKAQASLELAAEDEQHAAILGCGK